MTTQLCTCGSQVMAADCCQPFLLNQRLPATPEQLMRSRFSAFCQGHVDYLIATLLPANRGPTDREVLTYSIAETEWLGLVIVSAEVPQMAQSNLQKVGFVEFAAFFQPRKRQTDATKTSLLPYHQIQSAPIGQMHEKSKFLWQEGRWFYVDGVQLEPFKLGRNAPCWCGSSKRYKQCHG